MLSIICTTVRVRWIQEVTRRGTADQLWQSTAAINAIAADRQSCDLALTKNRTRYH